ncbi:MAG: hypothetical protein RLZZ21_1284, partial [Planctomycetota bacterium]
MEAVVTADRANLALGEKSGCRQRAEAFLNAGGVVVGLVEEPAAPAVAGEDERSGRGGARVAFRHEQLSEVIVGTRRIPHVELHGLS